MDFVGKELGAGKARVYAFWFRKTPDARAAIMEARRSVIPESVRVVRKANVLTFVQTQSKGFADDVVNHGLNTVGP